MPNFTLAQVRELLEQYTTEVGQAFAPEVITSIHKQTAGQPFLVNRCAQILTEELNIPKTETITIAHFSKALTQLLRERNTNIEPLLTNIRRNLRFESLLMRIASYERGLPFSLDNALMNALTVYGVIAEGAVSAGMFLEVQTGRGRIDLLIRHNQRKYIVETKIWEGDRYHQAGKKQLGAYLKFEGAQEGYYIAFDRRNKPTSRVEKETVDQ